MQEVFLHQWGNPSSLHHWGQRAATVLELARMQVARFIGAPSSESMIFTSGGTEADNLALMGIARRYRSPQHLIISSVEHSAIAQPAQFLQQWGWRVTRLPVNRQGQVNPVDLSQAIAPDTVLISIIYGQSEVGTLQPIPELGEIARAAGVLFHTDAVQVAGRLPLKVKNLPVDLLSISSHKIYGPPGVGALYVRPGVQLSPWLGGGGQEGGIRSGTEATAAIAGFGIAAELASEELLPEALRLQQLRDSLFEQLAEVEELVPTGDRLHRLPHHASFCLTDTRKITGKTLVRHMNLAGIGISAGSACHSGKIAPSPILTAMGYSEAEAIGGIRFTLGKDTTAADIDWTALVLKQILHRLLATEEVIAEKRQQVGYGMGD